MDSEKYFDKNGFIYGIRYGLDRERNYLIYFDDFSRASWWAQHPQTDESHNLVSKTKAEEWRRKHGFALEYIALV